MIKIFSIVKLLKFKVLHAQDFELQKLQTFLHKQLTAVLKTWWIHWITNICCCCGIPYFTTISLILCDWCYNNNTEHLLGTYYAMNFTRCCPMKHSDKKQSSHPKSVHIYHQTHQIIPIIPSNRTYTQHTTKQHNHLVYNHSLQSYKQSCLVVYSKQYKISV